MTILQPFPRLARFPVLSTCAFILDSKPVSINETYGARAIPNGKGGHRAKLFMRGDAADRKALIGRAAEYTMRTHNGWPEDLWSVKHVRMSIYVFNVRAGTDAANEIKLAADACESILYRNDNVVSVGEIPKPERDQYKTPRVEYVFDLIEVLPEMWARKAELDWLASRRQDLMKTAGDLLLPPGARALAHAEQKEVQAAFVACQAKIAALITTPQL